MSTRMLDSPVPSVAACDRVEVWRVALTADGKGGDLTHPFLDAAERAHAKRLRHGAASWAAARAALRAVLGQSLGVEPRALTFGVDAAGRPRLAPGHGLDLRFSLSHTDGIALIALRLGRNVGVDVERVRGDVDEPAVAGLVLGAAVRAQLALLAGARRREAFFRAWVRREALAKASGRGIATAAEAGEGASYSVRDLAGIEGCAAAVASEGESWTLARVRASSPLPR